MSTYAPTAEGLRVAQASGLEALATRLNDDYNQEPLIPNLVDQSRFSYVHDIEDYTQEAIRTSLRSVSGNEAAQMHRGLSLTEQQSWRYTHNLSLDGLFAHPVLKPLAPSSEADTLVLSGVVGMQYLNYRNNCRLFAKSRYREFGFNSFVESLSFAGAYLIGQATKHASEIFGQAPETTYHDGSLEHSISIGGDVHGDLRVTEKTRIVDHVIAPTNQDVLFSPVAQSTIGGYHSSEPQLTYAMLANTFIAYGKEGLSAQVDAFTNQVQVLKERYSQEPKSNNLLPVAYADYGMSEVDFEISRLRALVGTGIDADLERATDTPIYSAPYLPQSAMLFEICHAVEGIRLQNRERDNEQAFNTLTIPREIFPGVFSVLIQQAKLALGRTSPREHLELLEVATEICSAR